MSCVNHTEVWVRWTRNISVGYQQSRTEVSLVCYYNDKSIRNIPSIINSCCEERIAWFQDRIDSNYYTNYVYESRSLGNEEGKRELASSLFQKGKGKGLRGRKWLAETTPGSVNDAKRFPFSRREGEGLERWKQNSIREMPAVPFVHDIGAGNRPFGSPRPIRYRL